MPFQQVNSDQIELLSPFFQKRKDPFFAYSKVTSMYANLLGLRGFWPMSTISAVGDVIDMSGDLQHLTYTGNPGFNMGVFQPYIDLDGNGDYLTRADEAKLSITGAETYMARPGLTLGAWAWFDAVAGANPNQVMGKYGDTGGANQRSYLLRTDGTPVANFAISSDGTAANTVTVSGALPATGVWYFLVGRFTPQTELALWMNDTKYTNAVAIPAAIFDSTAPFQIGRRDFTPTYLNGRVTLAFLCAASLPDYEILSLYHGTRVLFGR